MFQFLDHFLLAMSNLYNCKYKKLPFVKYKSYILFIAANQPTENFMFLLSCV